MKNALTLLVVLFAIGCASRPLYERVSFADPSPFTRSGCKLAVEDIRSDHLVVEGKPEAGWLAGRTAKQQESYQGDKRTGQAKFTEELQKRVAALLVAAGTTGDNVFVLRPTFTDWDPGVYGFVGRPAAARITFDVSDAAGRAIDQFTFQGKTMGFSSGERMWGAYVSAAWAVEQYLHDRWSCAAH